MPRYVAFLGSINVSANRIGMAELRHALEREDFEEVETVVASGNVLFTHEDRPTEGLEDKLAHILRERFDIESFAAVRSRDELAGAITGNPFAANGDPSKVHTLFLSGEPGAGAFAGLLAAYQGRGPERLAIGPRSLYVDYVDGVGRSNLTSGFIERRLGCRGTARSINSLQRILAKMA
jgi:uncharacterized protein (DUF1697 family)